MMFWVFMNIYLAGVRLRGLFDTASNADGKCGFLGVVRFEFEGPEIAPGFAGDRGHVDMKGASRLHFVDVIDKLVFEVKGQGLNLKVFFVQALDFYGFFDDGV